VALLRELESLWFASKVAGRRGDVAAMDSNCASGWDPFAPEDAELQRHVHRLVLDAIAQWLPNASNNVVAAIERARRLPTSLTQADARERRPHVIRQMETSTDEILNWGKTQRALRSANSSREIRIQSVDVAAVGHPCSLRLL
jgi:hypothetical protein